MVMLKMIQMESNTERVKMSWRKDCLRSSIEDKMMKIVTTLPATTKDNYLTPREY